MKAAVIVFPGSNREHDIARAIRLAGGKADLVWHGETSAPAADIFVLPGGFSYGDYLRCGAMAAHSPIMRDVVARAKAGTPVLGVCNGFQILCESGLLPGTLQRNASLKFVCRDVWLAVENSRTLYTHNYRIGEIAKVVVAHGDGNYFADPETLDRLEGEGRVVFRYCDRAGRASAAANPNGAQRNIAGICDPTGRILGLMPHPENACEPLLGSTDGLKLFQSLVESMG